MAEKYDSFDLEPQSVIESKMTEIIRAASQSGALGYKIPVVDSYGGQVDDDPEVLVKNSSPAVWVTYVGDSDPGRKLNRPDCALTYLIIVYVRNVRNEKASRFGGSKQAGAYRILNDIKRMFIDQDFGLPIKPFEFVSTRPIYSGRLKGHFTSIYGITFKTRSFLSVLQKKAADLDDFLRLFSTWTIGTEKSEFNFNVRSKNNHE